MGNAPKRHHFVPQVYLKSWADEHGRIAVRRRGNSSVVITATRNVGLNNGLYGTGQEAVQRERAFSELESHWPELHAELLASKCRSKEVREQVAGFLSIQRLRTREQCAQEDFLVSVASEIDELFISEARMREFLTVRWGNPDPSPSEVKGASDFYNAAVSMNGGNNAFEKRRGLDNPVHVETVLETLLARHWYIRHAAKPVLMTSDAPVVLWSPKSERDEYRGIGLGNAAEVWFPLDQRNLLVMSKSAGMRGLVDVPVKSLERVSQEIASRSFEAVFGNPSDKWILEQMRLGTSKPAMRFNTGPMYEKSWDGREIYKGEVVHTWFQSHD